jgi:hypothetical protein
LTSSKYQAGTGQANLGSFITGISQAFIISKAKATCQDIASFQVCTFQSTCSTIAEGNCSCACSFNKSA